MVGNQIREGICVRYEHRGKMGILKSKSFIFLILDGSAKSNPDHIDSEDVA